MLALKPCMTAISVNTHEHLPDVIRSIMEAVKSDEPDIQAGDFAKNEMAELRLKGVG